MGNDVVNCPDHIYNIRGSLITWTLMNRSHDAFIVWILAQDICRSLNDNYTARVSAGKLINHLIISMQCTRDLAIRRLNKSIRAGFLSKDSSGYCIITGHNRMVDIVFEKYKIEQNNNKSKFKPEFLFLDDIQFSIKGKHLIDPSSPNITKALLYGLMSVYGNRQFWSRETHASLMGNRRDAVIKLSKKSQVDEFATYILIDPMSLLFKPDCDTLEAIEAFRQAESMYRFGTNKRVRGREVLQKRRVRARDSEKTYLTIQLPNTYSSTRIIKEVPVKFKGLAALLEPGEGTARRLDPDRAQKPRLLGCTPPGGGSVDQSGGRRECLSGGREAFLNSRDLAGVDSLPDSLIYRYLATFGEMLEDEDCRDTILDVTRAQDLKPLSAITPQIWRHKVYQRTNTLCKKEETRQE